jgi:hypothetical protein
LGTNPRFDVWIIVIESVLLGEPAGNRYLATIVYDAENYIENHIGHSLPLPNYPEPKINKRLIQS